MSEAPHETSRLDQLEAEVRTLKSQQLTLAQAAREAMLESDVLDAIEHMSFERWLRVGYARRWIMQQFCAEHDRTPVTDKEQHALQLGYEFCLPALRLHSDSVDVLMEGNEEA